MNENSARQMPAVVSEDGTGSDDPDPGPITLLVADEAWRGLGDIEAAVCEAARAVTAKVPAVAGREAVVLLSSDEEVRALNAGFRGQDKATNVLSFPAAVPRGLPASEAPLGDIIIARETVLREAAGEHKRPLDHLAHLTVHGLLHLAGFDHETDEDADAMEALERAILASIGISDPYQTRPGDLPSPRQGLPL